MSKEKDLEQKPEALTSEQRQEIASILDKKGATQPCPRCGTRSFNVLDGYFTHPLSPNIGQVDLSGLSVPSVVVVCNNCGFISEHALGKLGLLDRDEDE